MGSARSFAFSCDTAPSPNVLLHLFIYFFIFFFKEITSQWTRALENVCNNRVLTNRLMNAIGSCIVLAAPYT